MTRIKGTDKVSQCGIWMYLLKTLEKLGGTGTGEEIYLASTFEFGSTNVSKLLRETGSRGLTAPTGEVKKYDTDGKFHQVHCITKKGKYLLSNRLKYLEVRTHSTFVKLGEISKKIEHTGFTTSPLYGHRLASTWLSPLPEVHDMKSSGNRVTDFTYADTIMMLVEAQAAERTPGYKKEYEGDMNPNFIPLIFIRGTARDTYYVNPLELKITCELKESLRFGIEISYWPLLIAGSSISREDQESLGYMLEAKDESLALRTLYGYPKVLPGEPEEFLAKYGEYLQLLRFSNPPTKQVCSELNPDIYFV